MKCKVCGAESGKYPLCRACNIKKENGEIIKCSSCGNWHSPNIPCIPKESEQYVSITNSFVYSKKKKLISKSEQEYYTAILASLPAGYHAFPQVNLSSFIVKNDNSPFRNELFRNIDFLITNETYESLFVIEINDQTHLNSDRKERDEKVQKICEEAGIPIIKFWTSYGVNEKYIQKRISETLVSLPVERVHHFNASTTPKSPAIPYTPPTTTTNEPANHLGKRQAGCYIATCVYGSYDCPEVWVLRRFRDNYLASTWYGRSFIKCYYAVSPLIVKLFGKFNWFHRVWKPVLNKIVFKLQKNGYHDTPYHDTTWN